MLYAALILLLAALAVACWCRTLVRMPGASFRGPLPEPSAAEAGLAAQLRADVETLAERFPNRHVGCFAELDAARAHLARRLEDAGHAVSEQAFDVCGLRCANLLVEVEGRRHPDEIVVVGAHYDCVAGSPGADDNASGVAGVVALARAHARAEPARTVRFALFVNEEAPHFGTPAMGSLVSARACRARGERIVAMLSLEMLGYYDDRSGSQRYPAPLGALYPDTGDFVAFVGTLGARRLVRRLCRAFRAHAQFPSEGAALPALLPGITWSDHWAFGHCGYPAAMVTDTAMYRNPHYHAPSDRAATLDYGRMARVVAGLDRVVTELSGGRVTAGSG